MDSESKSKIKSTKNIIIRKLQGIKQKDKISNKCVIKD